RPGGWCRVVVCGLALFATPRASRAQLSLVAYGPERVAACEAAEVSVAATIPGTAAPRIGLPSFAPFALLRTSQSSRTGVDAAGKVFTFVEGRYVLTTDRVGTFTIAPFEIRTSAGVARSRPVTIRVVPAAVAIPNVVARARIDTSLEVNFRALVHPETVYVGQQATYEVAVFLGEQVRERLRRSPTFYPPEMQSMLAYDLGSSRGEPPRRRVGARCFDALVYQRAIFPLMPGRFVIPPAQLSYSLALSSSIFSREESREVRTDSVLLVAVDPPRAGRPDDFTGAVGSFAVRSRLDTGAARVGDPLRLTVRVEGTGNVKLLPRPAVTIPWAGLVPADERVQVDSTATLVRGAKEFDWVLTPHLAGELDLPPVQYPYFDPTRATYLTATAPPLRVRVAPGALAGATDSITREAPLPLRERYRGPARTPLHQRPVFWALLALAPLPAVSRRVRRARRARRPRAAPDAALRAAAAAPSDVRTLRRAFIDAAADRIGIPAEAFTRVGALARALRRAGVSRDTAARADALLRELDARAFGGSAPGDAAIGARALEVLARVDEEALTRQELRSDGLPTLLVAVAVGGLLAATAWAASPGTRAQFEDARRAYAAARFGEAQRQFATIANRVPDAPDAWANLGTAAWAAGDTAIAVVGWQRALRLEPLADDVRERLDLLGGSELSSLGFVPPLSVDLLALLAGALWCAAWLVDLFSTRLPRYSRALRIALGTLAGVLVLVAV
ncbi:MAG TPA: BatD family protein, partial [Gemmatimonadaceae bacterium]|nr:BatD family protein [Gemmatimonadaceae bacterium]